MKLQYQLSGTKSGTKSGTEKEYASSHSHRQSQKDGGTPSLSPNEHADFYVLGRLSLLPPSCGGLASKGLAAPKLQGSSSNQALTFLYRFSNPGLEKH